MAAFATPVITHQFFDDAGDPVASGKVYTYSSGTTTNKTTYSDQAGTIPNANPIILDSAGCCNMWLGSGEYTIRLETSAGALVRSEDHISGVATAADISGKLDSSTAASTYALKNNTVLTGTLSVAGNATFSAKLSVTADAASVNEVPRLSQVAGLTIPSFSNLLITASGTNANVSVSADQVVLQGTGVAYKASAVSLTINSSSSGANGLDVGASAANTWYSIWVIYNPTTTTVAGLLSLSATAPTMPSGYTMKALVGWTRTDSTASKYPLSFYQVDRRAHYKIAAGSNVTAYPIVITGNYASWTAAAMAAFVPTGVQCIFHGAIYASGNTSGPQASIAANSVGVFVASVQVAGPGVVFAIPFSFPLESGNIYFQSSNAIAARIDALGWEISI